MGRVGGREGCSRSWEEKKGGRKLEGGLAGSNSKSTAAWRLREAGQASAVPATAAGPSTSAPPHPHPTLIAEEMAVLSTSTQPSSSSRQSRKVSAPTNLTATPSAKLSTLLRATRRPWASDCVIALAPAAGARSLPSSSPGRSGRLLTAGCVFVLTGVTQRQAGQHAEAQEGAPEGASVGARSGVG